MIRGAAPAAVPTPEPPKLGAEIPPETPAEAAPKVMVQVRNPHTGVVTVGAVKGRPKVMIPPGDSPMDADVWAAIKPLRAVRERGLTAFTLL